MLELTKDNFAKTAKKGNVIIDFWAPWCGPCRMMAPVFEETAKGHKDVVFAKVNVDEEPEIAQEFGVRGIPTMVFLKDGEEVNRVVGAGSKAMLESKIKETF
jgi:thioredoxin 1